jgi:hypothetical protein
MQPFILDQRWRSWEFDRYYFLGNFIHFLDGGENFWAGSGKKSNCFHTLRLSLRCVTQWPKTATSTARAILLNGGFDYLSSCIVQ